MIWAAGMTSFLVADAAEGAAKVGPPYHLGIVQAAPIVGALWGIVLWREFTGGGSRTKALVGAMLFLFLVGLALVSMAPMY